MAEFTLQITQPDGKSEVRAFSAPRVAIGRGESDIVVNDPHASGRHGEFVMEGERLGYQDLGSSNGSFTENGERITAAIPVGPGTKIRIGKTVIEVRSVGREIAKTQLLGGTMLGAVDSSAAGKAVGPPRERGAAPPPSYVDSAPIEVPPWMAEAKDAPDHRPAKAIAGGRKSPVSPRGTASRATATGTPASRHGDVGASAASSSAAAAVPAGSQKPGFFARLFGRGAGRPGVGGSAAEAAPGSSSAPSSPSGTPAGAPSGAAAGRSSAPAGAPGGASAGSSAGGGSSPSSGADAGAGYGDSGAAGGAAPATPGRAADTPAAGAGAGIGPAGRAGPPGGGPGGPGLAGFKAGLAAAFNAATDGTPRMAPLKPASGPLLPLATLAIKDGIAELTGIVGHFKKLPKGWFQDVVGSLKQAFELLKGCWLQAALVLGVLLIPNAILGWLGTIIPFLGIITFPVTLALSLVGVLGQAALVLMMARAHLGLRTSAVAAWRAAIPGALNRWVALLVSGIFAGLASILLIIPGAALGVFFVAACVLEGHGMIDANRRSLEIWKAGPAPLLVGALLLGVAMSVVVIPVGIVCGFIPFIGPLIGGLLVAAVSALGSGLFAAWIVQRYFAHRRVQEGGDPEAAVRQVIG